MTYLVTWGPGGRDQTEWRTADLATAWAEAVATGYQPATIYARDAAGGWEAQIVTQGTRVPGTMAPAGEERP